LTFLFFFLVYLTLPENTSQNHLDLYVQWLYSSNVLPKQKCYFISEWNIFFFLGGGGSIKK
jgi:hypothetical protein